MKQLSVDERISHVLAIRHLELEQVFWVEIYDELIDHAMFVDCVGRELLLRLKWQKYSRQN